MENNENNRLLNIYFIESHITSNKINVRISGKSKEEANDLHLEYKEQRIKNNTEFQISIFCVKLVINKRKIKNTNIDIIIKLDDENKYSFEGVLNINNFDNDTFIFDFKFNKILGWVLSTKPPLSLNLSHKEQYNLYYNYIEKNFGLKDKKYNELIISTIKMMEGIQNKFNLSFYYEIIFQTIKNNNKFLIPRLLDLFNVNKINEIGIINEEQL